MRKFLKIWFFISISLIAKETYAGTAAIVAAIMATNNNNHAMARKSSFKSSYSYNKPVSGIVEYYCNGLYNHKLDNWMCVDKKDNTRLMTVENYAKAYTCGDLTSYEPIATKKEFGLIVIKTFQFFEDCE